MKGRVKGVFLVIIGIFFLLLTITGKSKDKAFYENAKTTTGTVKMISTEEKKVRSRRRRGVRRTRTVTKYNAHVTYDVEKNGVIVTQTNLFEDVSSNLKEGDAVTVYYTDNEVKIKSEAQSNSNSTMMLIFSVVAMIVGAITCYQSKPDGEYDELLGEENIYSNYKNN